MHRLGAYADQHPIFGQPAPAFTLKGIQGKPHSLADYKGHPVTLFFFCGCTWCAEMAQEWGKVQQSETLAASPSKGSSVPTTIIVYSSGAEELKALAKSAHLDPAHTVLLLDQEMQVTNEYEADTCPRVFVLDANGTIRYTNNHSDDAPRKAKASVIASHAFSALDSIRDKRLETTANALLPQIPRPAISKQSASPNQPPSGNPQDQTANPAASNPPLPTDQDEKSLALSVIDDHGQTNSSYEFSPVRLGQKAG